jgi:hypothetical protein
MASQPSFETTLDDQASRGRNASFDLTFVFIIDPYGESIIRRSIVGIDWRITVSSIRASCSAAI